MTDLGFFLRLLGRRRWWLLAGTLLMLLTAVASFGLLALSGWFITATGLTGLALAAGAAMTLDIYRPGAGIRFFAVSRAVARYGERLVNHEAVFRILADLRLWFFRALLPMRRGALGRFRDGELLNRITADIDTLDHLYLRVLGPSATAALGLALGLGFIAWLAPALALASALILIPAAVAIPWLTHRTAGSLATRGAARASALREQAIGDLQALAELQAYGAAAARLRLLERRDAEYLAGERRLLRHRGLADAAMMLASLLALWSALALGARAVGDGFSGPVMVGVVLGLLAIGEVLTPLPLAYQMLGRVGWAAARLRGVTRGDGAEAVGDAPPPPGTTLRFDNVSFRHRPGQEPCLERLDLTLQPGERVGILGPSGTGKSTLLHLALADLRPGAGAVSLDGVPLERIDPDLLQGRFALLEQRATLFAASIATNLRLGCTDADEGRLHEALEAVDLGGMVRSMPQGLDTWLGEGGAGLSGGQARRLALARTLLKPAAIVLLDEPTEGLDTETEQRVLGGIHWLLGGRSLIVIGHDARRFPPVDRLFSLVDGRLQPIAPVRDAPSGSAP